MLKNKLKIAVILSAILVLISTFSFATSSEDVLSDPNASAEDLLAAYQGEENTEEAKENEEENIDEEQVYTTGNSIDDDWVNDDLYKIDEKVEINQIVDGNVYVIAEEVIISSEIGGNVYIMAEKVTINDSAYIYSSLYAIGNEITINGIVCDAYLLGNEITIGNNGYIYRDLRASANKINLDGKVRRNTYLTGNELNFNAENGALIGGNLVYSSKNEATVPEGAVMGEVEFNQKVQEVKAVSVISIITSYIFAALSTLVYIAVVILLAMWLAPKFVEKITNTTTNDALISLAIGIATPFVLSIAIVILLITGIAAKVGLASLLILALVCMSGSAITSIYLGNICAKQLKFEGKTGFVVSSLIVALIIWVVGKIPFIGFLVSIISSVLGIGLLVFNIFNKKVNNSNKEVTESDVKE